jgi:asparagine synthase (glutamine-hydrolysing)
MCGIVGSLSIDRERKKDLNLSLNKINHRGPDDRGLWQDDLISLGQVRLAILDLSSLGHQPMSYAGERFWIVFNGEIYNYLELREELIELGYQFISQTDTEVILAAYAQWREGCLLQFRGMFALAIWDREEKKLFLARDRFGEKPLYYWYDGGVFCFASELKGLIPLLPEIPELEPIAIDLYLHHQYVPEPKTPLAGVLKLPAAHYLSVDSQQGTIALERYWGLESIEPLEGDPPSLIRQELEKTIELTLRSDVPVGVALSAGIDSGAIAALAAPKYKDTLQCFSIGYQGRPPYDERAKAEELANKLGLPFYDVELSTQAFVDFFPTLVEIVDEPIADIAAFGHYSVNKIAADRGVKVLLTGIGGDELFWGYSWVVKAARLTERKKELLNNSTSLKGIDWSRLTKSEIYQKLTYSPKIPKSIRSLLYSCLQLSLLSSTSSQGAIFYELLPESIAASHHCQQLYHPEFAARLAPNNAYLPSQINLETTDNPSLRIEQLLFDTWLVSNCLSLGDRVSMASGVEARLPLIDYKLAEVAIGLSKTQSDRDLGHKFRLKQALQGILPESVLNRPKTGFQPPFQEWMRGAIDKHLSLLESGYLIKFKVISSEKLEIILKQFENNNRYNFTLYKLLILEIWYRRIVRQENLNN